MLPLAALAQTVVPSLNHVPAQIRAADGQAQYAEQMAGTDVPDNMGWDFARNQSPWPREVLRALLLPDAEPQQVAIALRPWSRQAGHYLLLACVMAPEYKGAAAASCGSHGRREVVVALLRADAAGRPQLAARPWHEHLDEAHATASSLTLTDHIGEEVPGSLLRWDMADYRLNADTLAFGIRTASFHGYAGGGAWTNGLTLFAVVKGQLRPVLQVPIYAFEDLAGEWNADGTRQRHVTESMAVLVMQKQQQHGYHDILWRGRSGHFTEQQRYRWQPQQQRYR